MTGDDDDGHDLTFSVAAGPEHGTVDMADDGRFTYEPGATFVGDDTFTFRAFDGYGCSDPATVTVTVLELPTVSIAVGNGPQAEGDLTSTGLTFELTLSEARPRPVRVQVDTADGTALVWDQDYQPLEAHVVTFEPGGPLMQTVTVYAWSDLVIEPDETFSVILSQGERATIDAAQAEGTILNDDQGDQRVEVEVDFYTDDGDAPGVPLPNDVLLLDEPFFAVVRVADLRTVPSGLVSLSLDLAWDPSVLTELDTPFDPTPIGSRLVTASFPLNRSGVLDAAAGQINTLGGGSLPSGGEGQAIGVGQFDTFSVLHFQANEATEHGLLAVGLPLAGVSMADQVLVPILLEQQSFVVAQAPEISLADSSAAADDAHVRFTTPLSQYRTGREDSPLIRPGCPDGAQYVDVSNIGHSPLRIDEIRVSAPDVTADLVLTDDPADFLILDVGETRRIQLTFAPQLPSLADETYLDFHLSDGLVILSNAGNAPRAEVVLQGASTFTGDVNYDGRVGLAELGTLNVNYGKQASDLDWDPTSDVNGDGVVNLADLGPLNVEFDRVLPPGVPSNDPPTPSQAGASPAALGAAASASAASTVTSSAPDRALPPLAQPAAIAPSAPAPAAPLAPTDDTDSPISPSAAPPAPEADAASPATLLEGDLLADPASTDILIDLS